MGPCGSGRTLTLAFSMWSETCIDVDMSRSDRREFPSRSRGRAPVGGLGDSETEV